MRPRTFIIAVTLVAQCAAAETCMSMDPESAIDQAFADSAAMSKVPHRRVAVESASTIDRAFLNASGASAQICFADSFEPQMRELRAKVETEHPTKCMTFERAADVTGLRAHLRERGVATWREKTEPPSMHVCYLARDASKVNDAIRDIFGKTWNVMSSRGDR
jgi:hypothetical protein